MPKQESQLCPHATPLQYRFLILKTYFFFRCSVAMSTYTKLQQSPQSSFTRRKEPDQKLNYKRRNWRGLTSGISKFRKIAGWAEKIIRWRWAIYIKTGLTKFNQQILMKSQWSWSIRLDFISTGRYTWRANLQCINSCILSSWPNISKKGMLWTYSTQIQHFLARH